MYNLSAVIAISTIVIMISASGSCDPLKKDKIAAPLMSMDDAKRFGNEAVHTHFSDPDATVVPISKQFMPGFFIFEAESPNLVASPILGHFAVNSRTGDVWDMAGHCNHLQTPTLTEMQNRLRLQIHITAEEFGRLGNEKPGCDAEADN